MFTQSQRNNIEVVLKRFEELEQKPIWNVIDNCMLHLENLSNDQLNREAHLAVEKHQSGNPRCQVDHPKDTCMAPLIVQAASDVVIEHNLSGILSKDNRFLLMYYLSLSHAGNILS